MLIHISDFSDAVSRQQALPNITHSHTLFKLLNSDETHTTTITTTMMENKKKLLENHNLFLQYFTVETAILIDDIFTNVIDRKAISGLIINDTSDHLPAFVVVQSCTRTNKDVTTYKIIRQKSEGAINPFKKDLMIQDWNKVYVEDVDEAYDTNTDLIFILQKRAIRIVNKTTYREPTNPLFIKLNALKFKDLVDFKTIQIMYRVKNQQLPN